MMRFYVNPNMECLQNHIIQISHIQMYHYGKRLCDLTESLQSIIFTNRYEYPTMLRKRYIWRNTARVSASLAVGYIKTFSCYIVDCYA